MSVSIAYLFKCVQNATKTLPSGRINLKFDWLAEDVSVTCMDRCLQATVGQPSEVAFPNQRHLHFAFIEWKQTTKHRNIVVYLMQQFGILEVLFSLSTQAILSMFLEHAHEPRYHNERFLICTLLLLQKSPPWDDMRTKRMPSTKMMHQFDSCE